MLRTGEVAQILGSSRQHVVDLCDSGRIRSVRVGSHRRIPRSELERVKRSPLTREQEKSLWLHRALVTPLVLDPESVISKARANIERWRETQRHDGMTARWLSLWEEVLDSGVDTVIDRVTSPDPEACELRANSPFAGALSEEVRTQTLRSFKRHWRDEHEDLAS
ncbi:helix-turn-helix domain-containing protein [Nocardioides sp. zg-DK7169]|nr:helix-turn-helix domain-containing protein [Nocardioides sp. zg-DK7169]NPC98739.1 helix-turn-helix domain-containing protein [Nocardioides sp. zg-DK7169]